jgi:hypothetical protein
MIHMLNSGHCVCLSFGLVFLKDHVVVVSRGLSLGGWFSGLHTPCPWTCTVNVVTERY